MKPVKNSHCSFCGCRFAEAAVKHAICPGCGSETWLNPIPVSVMLLPVEHDGGLGILLVRRAIEPQRGLLGLPGGFLEFGETLEDGARRETREETGIILPAVWPVRYLHSRTVHGQMVLAFFEAAPIGDALLPDPFVPNEETLEIVIVHRPIELCFETHTEALAKWFRR